MEKISLKILLIASISGFVFFFNSDKTKSCGPDYDYDFDGSFKIFEEELFDIKNLEPFYLNEYVFNNVDENASIGPRLDNLKEWLDYFDNKPTIDDLEKYLHENYDKEVSSNVIGEFVMKQLAQIDQVAYVRFASVYRDFQDVGHFMKELKGLLQKTS